MNKFSSKVICDSIDERSNRITTLEVVFNRYILAELNTHRMFSRNSASSRAIPFEKMVKSVQENPFIPIAWQRFFTYLCKKLKQCIYIKQQTYLTVKFT